MATPFTEHIAHAACVPPSPASPPGSRALHLLYLQCLNFKIGDAYSNCGRTEVLYPASFVCLGANARLHQGKPSVLIAFAVSQ